MKVKDGEMVSFAYIDKNKHFIYDKLIKLEILYEFNDHGNMKVSTNINWNYHEYSRPYFPSYSKVGFIGELIETTDKNMLDLGYVLTIKDDFGTFGGIYICLDKQTIIHTDKRFQPQMKFKPVILTKIYREPD